MLGFAQSRMPGGLNDMLVRDLIAAIALIAGLALPLGAQAHDESKFPDWSGQWLRTYGGNPRFDPSKPIRKQEAPLKPEYQARFEQSIKDQDAGGHGNDLAYTCLPQGMPRMMSGVSPMEFLFTPDVTYILSHRNEFAPRRIYTDGRPWPKEMEPTFVGYSIGRWIDSDGDGRYDTLEAETRHMRGPKSWDQSGMPMADDDDGIIKERLFLDKNDPTILHNEMTAIDNSLTRPWSTTRAYKRVKSAKEAVWTEDNCIEGQAHVTIGKESYFLSGDGTIMPMRKDQPPPDLKYFNRPQR
jgi:hypothetical protein